MCRTPRSECLGGCKAQREHDDELRAAYRVLTSSGREALTLTRLAAVARDMGEDLAQDDLRIMMEEADRDRDGVVSEDEFLATMRKAMYY